MTGMRRWRPGLLLLLLVAPLLGTGAIPTASAFSVSPIEAFLDPPYTTYVVKPEGDPIDYEYRWTISAGACGQFTSNRDRASWFHHEDVGCEHDTVLHLGTITVFIKAKNGQTATCVYTGGSASGTGRACETEAPTPPTPTGPFSPDATILSPANGSTVLAGRDLVVHYRATDRDNDLRLVHVAFVRNDDASTKVQTNVAPGEGNHTIPGANLTPGMYKIEVTAMDMRYAYDEALVQVLVVPETASSDPAHVTVESRKCDVFYGGQMQPSQGAWQDDTEFDDRPGMQLTRTGGASYQAELPMVVDRSTLVFGVRQVHDEEDQGEPMRSLVYLSGMAFGSQPVKAFVRFSLIQDGIPRKLWDSPVVTELYILGPCDVAGHPFLASLPAAKGTLPTPFAIPKAGPYELRAELIRDDIRAPTGIKVSVEGHAVTTKAQRVFFAPVIGLAASASASSHDLLVNETRRIASDFAANASDSMPSPTQRWDTFLLRPFFPFNEIERAIEEDGWTDEVVRVAEILFTDDAQEAGQAVVHERIQRALLDDKLALGTTLAGADRTVVVMPRRDFATVLDVGSEVSGLSTSTKTAYVRADVGFWTVVHELSHMLPKFLWSSRGMNDECGRKYHNTGEDLGNGGRVTLGGLPNPLIFHERANYMGGGLSADLAEREWTDQCTYRHLVEALQGPVDPPVTIARAIVGRNANGTAGFLLPPYDTDGIVDLDAGGEGTWAFVALDADGNELSRYPFEPTFETPDGGPLEVVSFLQRLPRLDGAATLELHGPEGALDNVTLGGEAPNLSLDDLPGTLPPGTVSLAWNVSENASVTVLQSADGGQTWSPLAIEAIGLRSAEAVLSPGDTIIRVIARHGSASVTAETTTHVPAPPPTAPTPTSATPSPTAATPAGVDDKDAPLAWWIALAALVALAIARRRR